MTYSPDDTCWDVRSPARGRAIVAAPTESDAIAKGAEILGGWPISARALHTARDHRSSLSELYPAGRRPR